MYKTQEQVRAFHRDVLNAPISPAEPQIRHGQLRSALLLEEAIETAIALVGSTQAQTLVQSTLLRVLQKSAKESSEPNLIEAIDGCADLLVVTLGTFEDLGLDAEPFFNEVMRSNMTKRDPNRGQQQTQEPVGKAIKGPDFSPADIAGVLANTLPPVRNSCGCDGTLDDGCYNCSSDKWACQKCGFPLVRLRGPIAKSLAVNGRACAHCAGVTYTSEEWRSISFSGQEPTAEGGC